MEKYRVWDWQNFNTWSNEVWSLMGDVLTAPVLAAFKRTPPEYIVGDDLSWLDEIVERVTGDVVNTHEILTDRLSQHYDAIRAFHGSRPVDHDSILTQGLVPLDPTHFEQRAHELFLDGSFPELDTDAIKIGIRKVGRETREGRIYFEANEAFLKERCAHYMLYGSEYLCSIAANIPGTRDYRQFLKNFGTPTIFVCDVPLSLVDDWLLKELAGGALESMFLTLVTPNFNHADTFNGAAFSIGRPLPPQNIVGYRTPDVLKDPLLNDRLVRIDHSSKSKKSESARH